MHNVGVQCLQRPEESVGSLEIELQAAVSCLLYVLGSCVRGAASAQLPSLLSSIQIMHVLQQLFRAIQEELGEANHC